jgi:hypothetical protein
VACKRCGYNGTGRCPVCWPNAINKERLTDAINKSESRGEAGNKELVARPRLRDDGTQPGVLEKVAARTPNRRSRESYNTYMKTYMRAYRERSK